jgi:hypothetical protein
MFINGLVMAVTMTLKFSTIIINVWRLSTFLFLPGPLYVLIATDVFTLTSPIALLITSETVRKMLTLAVKGKQYGFKMVTSSIKT